MIDLITIILFLVVTVGFVGAYTYSLVLNLIRAIKTNKSIKTILTS